MSSYCGIYYILYIMWYLSNKQNLVKISIVIYMLTLRHDEDLESIKLHTPCCLLLGALSHAGTDHLSLREEMSHKPLTVVV